MTPMILSTVKPTTVVTIVPARHEPSKSEDMAKTAAKPRPNISCVVPIIWEYCSKKM